MTVWKTTWLPSAMRSALRAHARYRTGGAARPVAHPSSRSRSQNREAQDVPACSGHPGRAAGPGGAAGDANAGYQAPPVARCERNLKSASITIRLSKAECAQLRKRAAEAGLTVSAYLRSCTFEAETLRAQVKEALAQLRPATSKRNAAPHPASVRRSWLGMVVAIFVLVGIASQRMARA